MRRLAITLGLLLSLTMFVSAAAPPDDAVAGNTPTLLKATNPPGCNTSEMALCDVIADATRASGGTELAIINGGDVIHNLDGGETTWGDIRFLFSEDRALGVTEITGAELLELLEHGVSHATVDMSTETLDLEASAFDGFPQISGFSFSYDPSAPEGLRIVSMELDGGKNITSDMTLRLTAPIFMLEGGYGYPALEYQPMDVTLSEAMGRYYGGETLPEFRTGRITCIGMSDRFSFSRPMIFFVAIAAILISLSVRGFLQKHGGDHDIPDDFDCE